jgi:hypothetical protein
MFYAAINTYATETSSGFANTWGVLAFETRAARDSYVRSRADLATRAVTRKEIPQYVNGEIKPFTGERYMLGLAARDDIDGLLGEVYVGTELDAQAIKPLNT